MNFDIGPVLSLRDTTPNSWTISILVGCKHASLTKPSISDDAITASVATTLSTHRDVHVYRFDLDIPLQEKARKITYTFEGASWSFTVPAKRQRANMVFVSCNGFSSGKEAKKVDDKFALWKQLTTAHAELPYHVMIMGGDQVYADEIWTACPEIEKWTEKPILDRRRAKFTISMAQQVERFYFNLYCKRWSQVPLNQALATIPTTMMWDDHDIFDGWGSYEQEEQECDVYKGIFNIAKKYFKIFQQQLPGEGSETHPSAVEGTGLSNIHELHKSVVLTLDARSERSQKQVISPDNWDNIFKQLNSSTDNGLEHIFVVAPVPVVHADFSLLEKFGGWALGKVGLEDDMRDHWQNADHRIERLRLIHRLFGLMKNGGPKVTILSGDVHVACQGQIEKSLHGEETMIIDQLTASGIVHPSPAGLMGWVLNQLSKDPEPIDQGIVAKMTEFAAIREKYVLERNYLSLEPDEQGRIWANWNLEGPTRILTKVIHP